MKAHEVIYAAKDRIRKNEAIINRAAQLKDYRMVGQLRKENEKLRQEILRKYAIIV